MPAGCVLGPLRLPELSAFNDAADHGCRGDKQVPGGLKEGGGQTQHFPENATKNQTFITFRL